MAGRQGFEPRFYGSEPHVLPLDDLPACANEGVVYGKGPSRVNDLKTTQGRDAALFSNRARIFLAN